MATTEVLGKQECLDVKVRLGGGFVKKKLKGRNMVVYEGGWEFWRYGCKSKHESKPTEIRRSPRFKQETNKGVTEGEEAADKVGDRVPTESVKGKGKQGEQEGTSRGKKTNRKLELESESGSDFSDSEGTDIDWGAGEEECDDEGVEEARQLEDVQDKEEQQVFLESQLLQNEVALQTEFTSDSEELDSPRGSDDEHDNSPWFHATTHFSKPIQLVKYQKFMNNNVVRKALRVHAIENRLPSCTCVGGRRCHFKVVVRRSVNQDFWQIKSLNLKHNCLRDRSNHNLTTEYLAEKYIEEFRSDPLWKIKAFRRKVLGDLGIEITYSKAWMARARAKLKIYGSASEQYARVWDYGKAVLKYSPGSGCVVMVEGVEKPEPPLFLRMYMCLAPLAKGFLSGCRPLIGLDGTHLKGPYLRQILVAVGKDGNNNIYPIVSATVEIENKETWIFFLECLMGTLKDEEGGLGYTFMSDRQKGLLEALNQVVPNADTRYCVRHIWANFKLQFSGSKFKELFWSAARATTLFDFEVAMESIEFLSEEAYEYLADIPPKHWSRHAFSSFPKSNMLLNNVCETFNAVIKEARDKPILTQMEWLRRYMMKRNHDKWECCQKMEGKVTPYVKKTFKRIEPVARHCIVQELTGIPCVHAYACIMDKRADPEDYVDSAYAVDTYMLAYRFEVQPMSDPHHRDKVNLRAPMPPAIKIQPGRPKSKKRKLEQGQEGAQSQSVQKPVKRRSTCNNCGQQGHYAKTCKNPTVTPLAVSSPKNGGGRPQSDSD
ncbi:uncharacterized protein LOC110702287 [Chenopodium quinoa]|uniref:uncharacterized protein LOC110702287 n=1 Tax=Chenopodium quinoa TaxID=63459 RepID=UPI000B77A4F4|nr:uncharacterized protein LOC110702287 [Chenopodium quinoa]